MSATVAWFLGGMVGGGVVVIVAVSWYLSRRG